MLSLQKKLCFSLFSLQNFSFKSSGGGGGGLGMELTKANVRYGGTWVHVKRTKTNK